MGTICCCCNSQNINSNNTLTSSENNLINNYYNNNTITYQFIEQGLLNTNYDENILINTTYENYNISLKYILCERYNSIKIYCKLFQIFHHFKNKIDINLFEYIDTFGDKINFGKYDDMIYDIIDELIINNDINEKTFYDILYITKTDIDNYQTKIISILIQMNDLDSFQNKHLELNYEFLKNTIHEYPAHYKYIRQLFKNIIFEKFDNDMKNL